MTKKSKAQSGTAVQSQAITKTKMGIATAFLGAAALAAGSLAAPSGTCENFGVPPVVVNDTATLELCNGESFQAVIGDKGDDVINIFTVRKYNATNLYFIASGESSVPLSFLRGTQGSLGVSKQMGGWGGFEGDGGGDDQVSEWIPSGTIEVFVKYIGPTKEKKAKFAVLFQEIVPKDVCFDNDTEDDPWIPGSSKILSGANGQEIAQEFDGCEYEGLEKTSTYHIQWGCSAAGEIITTSKTPCDLSDGYLCNGGTCLPKQPKQPKIGKMTVTVNGQVFSTEKSVAKGDVFESGNTKYYIPDANSVSFDGTLYATVTVSLDFLEKTPGAVHAFHVLQSGTINPIDNEYFAKFVKNTIGQGNTDSVTFQIYEPFFSVYGFAFNSDGKSEVYKNISWLDDATMMEFAIQPTPTSTASSPTSTP